MGTIDRLIARGLHNRLSRIMTALSPALDSTLVHLKDLEHNKLVAEQICEDGIYGMSVDASLRNVADLTLKKGMLALYSYRISRRILEKGDIESALEFQLLAAIVLAVDIDPRCNLSPGIYLDHATGIVIGETAIVEPSVLIYHGVTLGSQSPRPAQHQRHPHIERNVTIGCNASVLGNIRVYKGSRIRAGTTVMTDFNNAKC